MVRWVMPLHCLLRQRSPDLRSLNSMRPLSTRHLAGKKYVTYKYLFLRSQHNLSYSSMER
jgi:hypothetical protein